LRLDSSFPYLVKRVIAVPGDRIHLRNGIVYLNGVAQDEAETAKPTPANYEPMSTIFRRSILPRNREFRRNGRNSQAPTSKVRTWSCLKTVIS